MYFIQLFFGYSIGIFTKKRLIKRITDNQNV